MKKKHKLGVIGLVAVLAASMIMPSVYAFETATVNEKDKVQGIAVDADSTNAENIIEEAEIEQEVSKQVPENKDASELANWKYSEKDGKIYLEQCINTTNKDIVVPSTIDGKDVVLGSGSLSTFFPADVTSIKIGEPDKKVTMQGSSLSGLFKGKASLQSADLSGLDVSKVSSLYETFLNCKNLKSLNLNGWNTSKIKDIDYVFKNCSSLTELHVSGWDTSNVTSAEEAFYGCASLEELGDVKEWNLSSLSWAYSMFRNCRNIQVFDLRKWNMPQDIGDTERATWYMFMIIGEDGTDDDVNTLVLSDNESLRQSLCSSEDRVRPGPVYHLNGGEVDGQTPGLGAVPGAIKYYGTSGIFVKSDVFQDFVTNQTISDRYTPVKEGYIFTGWYLDEQCTQPFLTEENGKEQIDMTTKYAVNLNLYAGWKQNKDYTVSYDTGLADIQIPDKIVKWNDTNLLPVDHLEKEGYTFDGWEFNGTIVDNTVSYGTLAASELLNGITLKAKWTARTYNVKYDTGFADIVVADKTVKWEDSDLLPADNPVKEGYLFKGWAFNGQAVDGAMTYGSLAADDTITSITFVAQWEKEDTTGSEGSQPPVNPDKPETPGSGNMNMDSNSSTGNSISNAKTGDETNIALLAVLVICSAAGMGVFFKKKKKDR